MCFEGKWAHEASEALRSSFALRHHDQMQANAVSQRAAWVLVARPLNCRLSDAVSTHVAPRNGGASVSGANWMYEASVTVSRSLAMRHHAWMLAIAVSQRAAWVPMLRSLIYSVSNAYRWAGGAENPAHLFQGHLGCLQRMGHVAGAWRCIIAIRCRQMLCQRARVGAGSAAAELP